jgi:hypothetical protein
MVLPKNLRRTVRLWLLEQPLRASPSAAAAGAVASFSSTTPTSTKTTATKTATSPPLSAQHPAVPAEEERPPSRFTAVFNAMDCKDAMRQYSLCIQKQLELHQNDYTAVKPKSCQSEFDAILACYRQARRQLLLQQQPQQHEQQTVDDDSKSH